jgi:hypothetical protein
MPDLDMTAGLIPLPPFIDRLIPDAHNKAWNNLGQRNANGFVLHRQLGSNWGTDKWFRFDPDTNRWPVGLTDYGQDNITGELIRWNDPLGDAHTVHATRNPVSNFWTYEDSGSAFKVGPNRAGWASGSVNEPYGDGLAFINKYGINAVNRDQVSWEIDGFYSDEWSVTAMQIAAQVCAHYAHDYGIPYDAWPIAPNDGFSFVRWHQEFTIGSGKVCPGTIVMQQTSQFIEMVREVLRTYQVKPAGGEIEQPTYTATVLPEWWAESVERQRPTDAKHNGATAYVMRRNFKAVDNTVRRSEPSTDAEPSGPSVKADEKVYTERLWTNPETGQEWLIENAGHWLLASKFSPDVRIKPRSS